MATIGQMLKARGIRARAEAEAQRRRGVPESQISLGGGGVSALRALERLEARSPQLSRDISRQVAQKVADIQLGSRVVGGSGVGAGGRTTGKKPTKPKGLSDFQLKKASSLTEAAQKLEFGKVIAPQQTTVSFFEGAETKISPGVEAKLKKLEEERIGLVRAKRRISLIESFSIIPSVQASQFQTIRGAQQTQFEKLLTPRKKITGEAAQEAFGMMGGARPLFKTEPPISKTQLEFISERGFLTDITKGFKKDEAGIITVPEEQFADISLQFEKTEAARQRVLREQEAKQKKEDEKLFNRLNKAISGADIPGGTGTVGEFFGKIETSAVGTRDFFDRAIGKLKGRADTTEQLLKNLDKISKGRDITKIQPGTIKAQAAGTLRLGRELFGEIAGAAEVGKTKPLKVPIIIGAAAVFKLGRGKLLRILPKTRKVVIGAEAGAVGTFVGVTGAELFFAKDLAERERIRGKRLAELGAFAAGFKLVSKPARRFEFKAARKKELTSIDTFIKDFGIKAEAPYVKFQPGIKTQVVTRLDIIGKPFKVEVPITKGTQLQLFPKEVGTLVKLGLTSRGIETQFIRQFGLDIPGRPFKPPTLKRFDVGLARFVDISPTTRFDVAFGRAGKPPIQRSLIDVVRIVSQRRRTLFDKEFLGAKIGRTFQETVVKTTTKSRFGKLVEPEFLVDLPKGFKPLGRLGRSKRAELRGQTVSELLKETSDFGFKSLLRTEKAERFSKVKDMVKSASKSRSKSKIDILSIVSQASLLRQLSLQQQAQLTRQGSFLEQIGIVKQISQQAQRQRQRSLQDTLGLTELVSDLAKPGDPLRPFFPGGGGRGRDIIEEITKPRKGKIGIPEFDRKRFKVERVTKKKKPKRLGRFQPSIVGLIEGRQKIARNFLTGLEVRGVPKGFDIKF